ncbi:NUDIX domain-containing protein [Streptomyces lonarensis]|uniref:NUDIX hydrolase n=1 Tax=Streptomyces lonarensis TaxID=700599 RepID=A0A7X6CWV4_9ACTN|nr:NUDIX hydrolase [Streptomyces lonarensis]NJQ04032.1 NUDIX hydrolase [Streptomyces lonarensis]
MTDAHPTDPPRRWITGQALLRNEAGAVLLTEGAGPAPSRRWSLVGADADPGETALTAAERAVRDRLRLRLRARRLLCADHLPTSALRLHSGLALVFDFGSIPGPAVLSLDLSDVTGYGWVRPDALDILDQQQRTRVEASLLSLHAGTTAFLPTHP